MICFAKHLSFIDQFYNTLRIIKQAHEAHEEITLMSKNVFKQIVKQKCEENGLEYLKHCIKSKGKEMNYEKLEIRKYLASESFLTLQEKKEAFMIRTRMTEVKTNYKNKHNDYNCVACEKKTNYNEETQEHIYYCHQIKHNSEEFKIHMKQK